MRFFILALAFLASFALPAFADESKRDDTVAYTISAEDWVTTKTARVTLSVEASVTSSNAGAMRTDMAKAVNDAAKADWRLTEFNRSQDQTGMERWSVSFESRLPESTLGGLADAAKKASKAGMQIRVADVDFSPTLEETEAVRAALRAKLMKAAADQLTAVNAALPGKNYRIANISFDPQVMPMRGGYRAKGMDNAMLMAAAPMPESAPAQERAQKLVMQARVVYAAVPPAGR